MAAHISIPKPFASGDATEWFKRFKICSKANQWNNATKAVKLPTLMEGEALAIWLGLSEEEQDDFSVTKEKLINAMNPTAFVSLEEFHRRKLCPSELVSVFVHDLKGLLDRAMPKVEKVVHDQHQFLTGLPDAVSRATGDVKTLDAAVERSRLLMALGDSSHMAAVVPQTASELEQLKEQVEKLTEMVAAIPVRQQRAKRQCYHCRRTGHLQRDCPFRDHCFTCGRPGHIAKN